MSKETKVQVKVAVGIELLWGALSKDLADVVPKVLTKVVKSTRLIEGDGGLGSLYHFEFYNDTPSMSYQKEKIVELDESVHKIALQVIEGGHLNEGFSLYTTVFQLTPIAEAETLVDVKVIYETEVEGTHMPRDTTKATSYFLRCLEEYLLKPAS